MNNEKLIEIISEQFDSYSGTITEDTNIIDDLNADSVDVVSLIMALEDEFDMGFDDSNIKEIKTVGDIIKYISAQE